MSWLALIFSILSQTGLICLLGQTGLGAAPQQRFEAYERSVAMVRGEISRHPRSAGLSLVLAQLHFKAARFNDALRVYEEGGRAHPNDHRFMTGLGKTYLARDELKMAIDALKRSLAAVGTGAPTRGVRLSLSEAYTRTGEFARAIEQLRAAARDGAPSAEILLRLGRALDTESRRLRSQGDTKPARGLAAEARRSLEESIRLRPGSADAHYTLGRLLARLGEKDLAKKRLEDFRRLRRKKGGVDEKQLSFTDSALEAGTALDLARALASMGETNQALGYTTRALGVLPRFEPAMVVRGSILLRARRTQEAVRAFEELLAAHAGHPTALMGLAEIYIARKDHQQASVYLLRAARSGRAGQAWEVLYQMAADGLALSKRAEEFARSALRARPSPDNYSNLAVAVFEAGKHAECEKVLRAGLARYPGHKDLLTGLQVLQDARKGKR